MNTEKILTIAKSIDETRQLIEKLNDPDETFSFCLRYTETRDMQNRIVEHVPSSKHIEISKTLMANFRESARRDLQENLAIKINELKLWVNEANEVLKKRFQ